MTTPTPKPDPQDDFHPVLYTFEQLKPWEQMFVTEYLIDGCPGKAATRAGMDGGHSANHLMKNPAVKAVIAQKMADRAHKLQITAEDVLRSLWAMATADKSELYGEGGQFKPITEWPEAFRLGAGLVTSIKTDSETGKVTEVRFADPLKIIELVGRHINVKAFERDVAVENNGQFNLVVRYIGGNGAPVDANPRNPVSLPTETSGPDRPPR